MPAYLSISLGSTATDARPILASNDDRLVRAALSAVQAETRRMLVENIEARTPESEHGRDRRMLDERNRRSAARRGTIPPQESPIAPRQMPAPARIGPRRG
jgi:hypothetical protein